MVQNKLKASGRRNKQLELQHVQVSVCCFAGTQPNADEDKPMKCDRRRRPTKGHELAMHLQASSTTIRNLNFNKKGIMV